MCLESIPVILTPNPGCFPQQGEIRIFGRSTVESRSAWLAALVTLVGFVILTGAIKTIPSLEAADLSAALWFNNMQYGQAIDAVMVNASLYGREYFWIPIVAILVLLGDRETKLVGVGLAAVFIAGIVAGELAKDVVARMRPGEVLASTGAAGTPIVRIPLDTDFSYPSGHALIVTIGAVYSLLTFSRKWLASLLTVESAIVCISRVYTFEHFPTDVLGGILLGTAIAFFGFYSSKTFLKSLYGTLAEALNKALRNG